MRQVGNLSMDGLRGYNHRLADGLATGLHAPRAMGDSTPSMPLAVGRVIAVPRLAMHLQAFRAGLPDLSTRRRVADELSERGLQYRALCVPPLRMIQTAEEVLPRARFLRTLGGFPFSYRQ